VPRIEQSEYGLEIVARHRDGLADCANRMVQPDTGIPDRVPKRVRELHDITAVGMQQHQIEVAARRELTPTVSANGDKGDPGSRAESPGQPHVGNDRQGLAKLCARQARGREDRGTRISKLAGRIVGHQWTRTARALPNS
jgi:hypothetical protein